MNILPKGYYAIRPETEGDTRASFTYRGVTYAVTAGENLFPDVFSAAAAADTAPGEVLAGLPYDSFSSPVLLFCAGEHKVDKFVFEKSQIWLGEGAGIDPDVPGDDPLTPPELSPLRTPENESVLKGSYWHGKIRVDDPGVRELVIDGFSSDKVRFIDGRSTGGYNYISFRNIVLAGSCGNTLYYFTPPAASGDLDREVLMKNIRLKDFDGLDYGGIVFELSGRRVTLEGICFDTTDKIFGFTDITRGYANGVAGGAPCTYVIRDSYFRNLDGEHGVSFAGEKGTIHAEVERCVFVNASRPGESPLQPQLSAGSQLIADRCVFADDRENPAAAITVSGSGSRVCTVKCRIEGLCGSVSFAPAVPVCAPETICAEAGTTQTADPHRTVSLSDADFSALDALYEGCRPYYGDLHVHTDCGGTSDGKTPMKDYPGEMDRVALDFAAVVDHRQMRGFFLPEWDDGKFIIGTEPGTGFLDLNACRCNQREVHYNMLFPHKYGLAMVLANFPEFEFHGDELTGSFRYPKFTKARFRELTEYVQSIGGIMVHPHPKTMLASDDPDDYYFGEHMFIETIYGAPSTHASFKNYDLWLRLLDRGYHVYTSGGSDSHGKVSNKAVAVFYTREKSGRAFFDKMHSADFSVGYFGMKMCVDGAPMGSEIAYRPGQVLTLRVGDLYAPAVRANTAYELRVYSDEGLAYASQWNGTGTQSLALEVRKRRFYRAEVFDLTHGCRVAVGNPVWLDKEPGTDAAAE